jgi:hypothetical protein
MPESGAKFFVDGVETRFTFNENVRGDVIVTRRRLWAGGGGAVSEGWFARLTASNDYQVP